MKAKYLMLSVNKRNSESKLAPFRNKKDAISFMKRFDTEKNRNKGWEYSLFQKL